MHILLSLPRIEDMFDGCAITLSILAIGLRRERHMILLFCVVWIFSCKAEAIQNVGPR